MAKRNTYFEDEKIEKKIDLKQFARVLKYILPHRKIFILVLCLMGVSSVTGLISPLLLRTIINKVTVNEDMRMLAMVIGAMAFIALTEISITYLHQTLMGRLGHNIIAVVRQDIFYKLQELPFDYFDSKPDGKIVVRVTDYVNDLANFFTNFVLMLITYFLKIAVVTFFMLSLSPQLTLVVFATVIPMMILVLLLRRVIGKLFAKLRAKNSNRTAFLLETIMGEKIIKSNNRSSLNHDIYVDVHTQCADQWFEIFKRNELNTPIVELFWNIGTLGLYGMALLLMLKGNSLMNAGTVVAFSAYMTQFSGPLTQIAVIIQQLAQVTSNLEQVFDTIDHPVDIADESDAVSLGEVKGKVDFNDVSFCYEEGVPILEHFDLHVEPGQTIALVGPTGAGKTTVINLLTRFYDVTTGNVSIDGMDVRSITLKSLRNKVGVLMQDPFLFKGSILENIRYGRPEATDEECMEAARTIHADKFIESLPEGYNTLLEERGGGLSAGQRQLVSFARIVLKNSPVVILDEATSAIDTETEKLIQEALETLLKGKTAFIVAHRLSTIRNADRILYIADKGIAESGTHEELMAKKGLYYALN
ncbi:MAG: ABC transporter ATP-binding protein/permease [Lachnospiraceae bacterium]|nr:ABC transporter ATP-binding protein/permease [Lachnospiraceae bacterium]